MSTTALPATGSGIDKAHRQVIFASSLGTVFEWYDFYLYGSLAAIISKQFFSGVNETTGFIFALLDGKQPVVFGDGEQSRDSPLKPRLELRTQLPHGC